MQKAGKVILVGAGPGHPDYITVRGRQCIETCDVLVYDYLVAPVMLEWAPKKAERICVGKRQGFHSMPQEDIQSLLVRLAAKGKCVVRLKGGDPMMFGRGGEEVRFLAQEGIEWEVVPGVTAALGAAASLGIPLTDRNYASGVLFLTGHEDPNKPEAAIDWESYGALGLTLCLYMSMKRLSDITTSLIRGGADAALPVRVVEWASTARERQCSGTLETIAERVAAAGIGSPAIVIIGEVAGQESFVRGESSESPAPK